MIVTLDDGWRRAHLPTAPSRLKRSGFEAACLLIVSISFSIGIGIFISIGIGISMSIGIGVAIGVINQHQHQWRIVIDDDQHRPELSNATVSQ